MQVQDKRQKKVVQLTPHMSSLHSVPRDTQSLSSSKSRKYFRLPGKSRLPTNDIINSFAKKSVKQTKTSNNDYGLAVEFKEAPALVRRSLFAQNSKEHLKFDACHFHSKIKLLKNSGHKKLRKYSEKTSSLDSFIRNSDNNFTPTRKSQLRVLEKSPGSPTLKLTREARKYEKTIEHLKSENEYYEGLYANSKQRIDQLQKEADDERKKLERVRKIYQQKMTKMASNKEACQNNLGHIFSYNGFGVDIVPEEVIVENSIECSTEELEVLSRKNSESTYSKLSVLSLNSR